MPTVLPVIDLLDGHVVRGVAGRRSEYRPIHSLLTPGSDPIEIASAIRHEFGLSRFYVADLNGILFQQPDFNLYRRLADCGFEVVVDAGIRSQSEAATAFDAKVSGIIIGLESCQSPDGLASLIQRYPDATFSLDLRQGEPILSDDARGWKPSVQQIIQQAVDAKINSLLILDLADVGMGTGGSTDSLCGFVRQQFPRLRLIAGGGVRGTRDLCRLFQSGVDEVLIASILHDRVISREELSQCCSNSITASDNPSG